jgi:hypothetical protein
MKFTQTAIAFFLAITALVSAAIAIEVFYVRRNRLVQNISSMVGEHLVKLRSLDKASGPMPVNMLIAAMNQKIDPSDDEAAKTAMETMMGIVVESKRRGFLLPMVHKDVAVAVRTWASKVESKSSVTAAKLLTHIMDRHVQQVEQLVAQSFAVISETDEKEAVTGIRSLSHILDGALAAGLSVNPNMVFMPPNSNTIRKWAAADSAPQAKAAAELFLATLKEAQETFDAPEQPL